MEIGSCSTKVGHVVFHTLFEMGKAAEGLQIDIRKLIYGHGTMNPGRTERLFLEDLPHCRYLCILKPVGAMLNMKGSTPSEDR